MIDHVYTYNPICIKIVRQLFYGFKSLQTFGEPTKKNQNHHFYMIFSKMVSKVSIPHKGFLRRSRNGGAAKPPTRPSLARAAPSLARAVLKPF